MKVRLQSTSKIGLLASIKLCYVEEGVLGFYKGMMLPVLTIPFVNALSLAANEFARKAIGTVHEKDLTITNSFICGAFSGVVITPLSTLVELVKIKLQVQRENKSTAFYKGVADLLIKEYSYFGIKGLFKGQFSTFLRETSGYGLQFWGYQLTKLFLAKIRGIEYDDLGSIDYMISGAFAGYIAWVLPLPFDVPKTMIQTGVIFGGKENNYGSFARDEIFFRETGIERFNYKPVCYDGGYWNCCKHLYYHKGIPGFFNGIVPISFFSIYANAIMFLMYEHCKQTFDKYLEMD